MNKEEWIIHLEKWVAKDKIRENEPMSEHTTFRTGGPAAIWITIDTRQRLAQVIPWMKQHEIPYFILGNGSNLLVSDQGYDGVVLSLGHEFTQIVQEGNRLRAGAALPLQKVAKAASDASLSGLEFAAGIPGSLGGGVVMNAGAYGGELVNVVAGVYAMDQEGKILYLDRDQLQLGYRTSVFKKKPYIVLEVVLQLVLGEQKAIESKMEDYNLQRARKQPLEYPSAGSTFKRPEGHFAGKLIMDAGLKGFSIGGAQVSQKHCGFVINKEGASSADILQLMMEVKKRVKDKFDVELEPEVILVGYDR